MEIYRRSIIIIKDGDSYNITNYKLSISFIFILRKCYTIGPFVPPFTGERHGDSESCFENCWKKFPSPFELDEDLLPEEPNYFTAPFNRSRMDQ